MNISIDQALNIWYELELAFQGKNSFGGDMAEIYCYTLMPHSPAYARNPQSEMFADTMEKLYRDAKNSLCGVINKFIEKHKCLITIDGTYFTEWEEGNYDFSHRCHVKIEKEQS